MVQLRRKLIQHVYECQTSFDADVSCYKAILSDNVRQMRKEKDLDYEFVDETSERWERPAKRQPKKKRSNFQPEITEVLWEWIDKHADYPFPTAEEKKLLCKKTGLTLVQLNNWMINARRRKLNGKFKRYDPLHHMKDDKE
ncbi:hypothetical protein O9G_002924 [Rozella allomycis CSF55]|uniref:Homeobox domain-containing protein n=1 Tax=Rozella allomycis (strain CSF55) TaxID=988480 RepID=A0A075ANJ5_ROZAC|nr:hypothetical protein O9G_002924 [Rozella allomycis CSF55]|eukprot:EPZ31455.1 hypothetical protein O9G_002924 [Rozella allomycis CSF55]